MPRRVSLYANGMAGGSGLVEGEMEAVGGASPHCVPTRLQNTGMERGSPFLGEWTRRSVGRSQHF